MVPIGNGVRRDDLRRPKPLERLARGVFDRQPALSCVLDGIDEMLARLVDDPRVLDPR